MPSGNGTFVTADSNAGITDAAGNLWSIQQGQVAVNLIPDPTTSHVTELAYVDGLIWQETANRLWFCKTTPDDAWQPPEGTSTGPTLPVQDDIILAVDADGNADAVSITPGATWSVVNGQATFNGTPDPTTAHVIELALIGGQIWQENAAGLWWMKSTPDQAWSSPDGLDGTHANPLNGAQFDVVTPPKRLPIQGLQLGDVTATGTPTAPAAVQLNPSLSIGSIHVTGMHLINSVFNIRELVSLSGPLVVNGDSDLHGSSAWLALTGTADLPPGSLVNNGTMTLEASALTFSGLSGNGVLSIVGDGSLIDVGSIGSGETIVLHGANLMLGKPRPISHAPATHAVSIICDPQSSVTMGWFGAVSQTLTTSEDGGELHLTGPGSTSADIHFTGVPQLYASPGPNGTTLLTPYDTGHSLPARGFMVADQATGRTDVLPGDSYEGPVSGLHARSGGS